MFSGWMFQAIQPTFRRNESAFTIIKVVIAPPIVAVFIAGICLITPDIFTMGKISRLRSGSS
jgi:hypothetical protein